MTSRNASSTEPGSTSGREAAEDLEQPRRRLLVGLGAVAGHEHLGPAALDLAQRHTGVDAERAGLVGRARDDLVGHDHRPAAQRGVVALLDRGEERVGVGVQDHHGPVSPDYRQNAVKCVMVRHPVW